ncbi:macrodomain Ter protein MatP [Vibrio sp. Of7-15]|uniref:macrodomain Ter protein MatP n=1 Tax=Vibrio sp. Of7-15 TaxID=2724879 RepID=UPI001EF284E5|nr:macrodomain Ter protein MatP [Vibrio sp. Of7-15]MCG7496325.1 macrodomain Ter protein MatP [Vibrio sp. Of7-15]
MKYQQLENLEAGWKWNYLVKKFKAGESITRYIDSSEQEHAVELLFAMEHDPTLVIDWINNHISLELENKLKQSIRAKRKRHFNAEQEHTRKKSIDLDFRVWEKLAERSNELGATLSDTIEYLLSEASRTEQAGLATDALKKDLHNLLDE